ncbi:hypothetical protein F2P79_020727 [Pimephales promelas]|nr:hypothetical protein F2P79_020727 [Pimephales promelas]
MNLSNIGQMNFVKFSETNCYVPRELDFPPPPLYFTDVLYHLFEATSSGYPPE